MEITFWGVRGSIPAPGPEFNRYGGNTSCVAVRTASGALIILDAGTGITALGRALLGEPGRGAVRATILLSHAHWDHIQGFPFFAPVYVPGNRFTIYGMSRSPSMLEGILEGQMNPHFSPVHSLRNLGAEIEFRAVHQGAIFEVERVKVRALANPHGRCAALAYRLEDADGSVVVYAPDAGYDDGPGPEVAELYRGAGLLIHDTTYTPEDQQARRSRGHSSIGSAARAAARAGAATLVMFHYDQDYTDQQVELLERRCRELLDGEPGGREVSLVAAREGVTIRLPAAPPPRS